MFGSAGFVFLGFSIVVAAIIVMSVRIYQVKPDFIKKLLKYGTLRKEMSEKGKKLVDGKGIERIISEIPREVLS